jgi:hypothetical protein
VRDGLVPYPPSADDLRVLMGWTEQRTATRRAVQLEYLLYSSDDLRALRGQTVVVKIDPRDLGQVWVRDPREGQRRFITVAANHPGYAPGLSLWQHRVICRLANAEADRDNVALLVDTKARIQQIVEREWSTTRRTRSRQVLARWLNQQGGPNVAHSVKLAEQALDEATRADDPRQRRPRSSSVRALPDSHSPGSDQVPASITQASITPIRRRLLTARAPFGITYAQEELDAGGAG